MTEEDIEVAPSRQLVARERKLELATSRTINCGYCRPHKGENATRISKHANPRKKGRRQRGGVREFD